MKRTVFAKAFKATFGVGCAIAVAIIAIALIGGALASKAAPSGSTATTTPPFVAGAAAPASAAGAKSWVVVKEWSGDGAEGTETFTVGNEWRVDWVNSVSVSWRHDEDIAGLTPQAQQRSGSAP
jgi:hypothetical protein